MEIQAIFEKYFKPVQYDSSKINCSICKECNGGCCKSMGCHISPHDLISVTKDSIRNLIDESQCISIDWWDGNPINNNCNGEKYFFLRIKNKDSFVVDPSFGGECFILQDNGCPLDFSFRPKGGRELIPAPGIEECIPKYSKKDCVIEWMPYNNILSELCEEYINKNDCTIPALLEHDKISPLEALVIAEKLLSSMIRH